MWATEHRAQFDSWHTESNTVVILSVPDADELDRLLARARSAGVPVSAFVDDDLGHRLTSVALGPHDRSRKLCQGYPLALRPSRKERAA